MSPYEDAHTDSSEWLINDQIGLPLVPQMR